METWTFEAIGTTWQIDSRQPLAPEVQGDVRGVIKRFDRAWSRFRADSVVTAMSHAGDSWEDLGFAASWLVELYDDLFAATDGAVTPLVGQALADLGYDADYSLVPGGGPYEVPDWGELRRSGAVSLSPRGVLVTDRPLLLDVGAAGKGLLVDLVSSAISRHGLNEFTVDASGDLYHHGTAPIRVALEHPADHTRAVGVAVLEPEDALCASATNRRVWGDGLHHVLDGRTGRPTSDVVATWVVVEQSCMRADGLATARFFDVAETYPHEYVRLHADGRLESSPGFRGELFT